MFRLIKFLFTGEWEIHHHEWEIHDTKQIISTDYITNKDRITGVCYIQKCKTCGELKEFVYEF